MLKTVLWLCNGPVERKSDPREGTFFASMVQGLAESGRIRLAAVTQAKVKGAIRCDICDIAQWIVPYESLGRNGLPSFRTVEAIHRAADEIKPDLIHVWGTDNYWGLLTARGILEGPAVLEMTGIKYACAGVFYGGLSLPERIRSIGPLEILRPGSSLFLGKRRFERWGRFEKEMILKHNYISTQSEWVRAHVLTIKPECTLFETGMMLRKEFLEAKPWSPEELQDSSVPIVFTISSGAPAYKGVHILIRAIAILKRKYPRIVLNVAGDIMKKGIRRSGYARWLQSEVHRLAIEDNIRWLGPLDAEGIIQQFHHASMITIPSFVESYSLVLAEAMMIGVPVVVSYAGAMPELARDEESALFFPPGDETACAWQMDRILSDKALSTRLSKNSRQTGLARNEPHAVLERQIGIYDEILGRGNQCS